MSLYDLSAELPKQSLPLKEYEGKPILFVNVASACGLTPQYTALQKLHEEYGPKGLTIIGFPCNQFMFQEPASDEEILQFCQLKYDVTFPIAKKADVNGPTAQPIYKVLKEKAGVKDIDWNFGKFLVKGDEVKWYGARTDPSSLKDDIEARL